MIDRDELERLYAEKATLADFYRAALDRWRGEADAVPEGKLIELRKKHRSDTQAGRALAEHYGLGDGSGREQRRRLVRSALEEFIFEANPANVPQGNEVSEMWAQNIRYNRDGEIISVTYPSKLEALKLLAAHVDVDAMVNRSSDESSMKVNVVNIMDTARERLALAGLEPANGIASVLERRLREERPEVLEERYERDD